MISGLSKLEKIAKGIRNITLAAALGIAAMGCGKGTDSPQGTTEVNGISADGPFQADSEVFINKLDNNLNGTSETTYSRTDALGRYTTKLPKKSCFLSTVTGRDFNEITAQGSSDDISISSFYCTEDSPKVSKTENDVTQMVLERQKSLYLDGASFTEASKQARDELFSQLEFIPTGYEPDCLPHEMNIITGPNSCNDPLFAVEIVVRNYAVNEAERTGNTVEYELHDIMSSIMFDLADGTLSQDIKDKLNNSAKQVNVTNATANLQEYLDTHGGTAKAPNANNVLDSDLDGIANNDDEDIDGDGVPNAEDSDPFDASIRNGTWYDESTGLEWQLEPPSDTYLLADAVQYCEKLSLGGHDDWHLPNIDELRTLVRGCAPTETSGECRVTDGCDMTCWDNSCLGCAAEEGPGADGCYLDSALDGPCDIYISSSTRPDLIEIPWVVDFEIGNVANITEPILPYFVRCVRTSE